jgi:hypothetical protein
MKTIDVLKRPIYAEKELLALIECKKRMDIKIFQSSSLFSVTSKWNEIRKFLLEKEIIKKQHNSYIWVGKEPDIKLADGFIKFYKSINNYEKKIVVSKKTVPENDANKLYEDYLSLNKQVQELKIQNREMYKELKKVFQEKMEFEKKYQDLKDKLKNLIYEPNKNNDENIKYLLEKFIFANKKL